MVDDHQWSMFRYDAVSCSNNTHFLFGGRYPAPVQVVYPCLSHLLSFSNGEPDPSTAVPMMESLGPRKHPRDFNSTRAFATSAHYVLVQITNSSAAERAACVAHALAASQHGRRVQEQNMVRCSASRASLQGPSGR